MSLIAVVSLSAACTTDLEQVQILPLDQVTAPVLEDLAFEEIVITSKNMGEKVSFAWSKADFGAQAVVSYSLAARNAGNAHPGGLWHRPPLPPPKAFRSNKPT